MSELTDGTENLQPTKVSVGLGFTKNVGNFESVRIDVRVEDSRRNGESVKDASDRVYAFVEAELIQKVALVTQELREVN